MEGQGGVLFVGETDPREVVVKPGEDFAAEGAMAALLHNEVGKAGKLGITMAPGFRVATPLESKDIKAALTPLLPTIKTMKVPPDRLKFLKHKYRDAKDPNTLKVAIENVKNQKKVRAQQLVDKLDEPGVAVQDVAAGKGLAKERAAVKQHTEKRLFAGTKLTKDSPLRIFKDRRSIQALGMTTAVDLFTGNQDRLLIMNPDNLMIAAYEPGKGRRVQGSLATIDNVYATGLMSSFQTRQITNDKRQKVTVTADDTLKTWRQDDDVKALAQGDYDPISKKIFDGMVKKMSEKDTGGAEGNKTDVELKKVLQSYEPRFLKYFSNGLAAGKRQLLTSIDSMITDPKRLQAHTPGIELSSILSTMKARRDFLKGKST
jgi:hypothetical protein